MKLSSLLNRSWFAALLLSASVSVFAAPSSDQQAATDPAAATSHDGKTRAQVRAELIQAEQAGIVPAGNTRYPADPELVARNRVEFQAAKNWWTAHGRGADWGN